MVSTRSVSKEENVQQWCKSIAASFDLGKTLFAGESGAAVVAELSASGVWISDNALEAASKGTAGWDTLILDQAGLEESQCIPADAFKDRFGTPRQVIVVISTIQNGPSLPEAAAWLWSVGYSRNFVTEIWADERTFISSFAYGTSHIGSVIETYEAEWWRQAQISHKRRLLLVEYMDELVNTLLGSYLTGKPDEESEYKRRLVEAGYRWEAFQNSRTWKIIQLLQKIRRLGRS